MKNKYKKDIFLQFAMGVLKMRKMEKVESYPNEYCHLVNLAIA